MTQRTIAMQIGNNFFRNIKLIEWLISNSFTLKINNEPVEVPLFNVISFSNEIVKMLQYDSTVREKDVKYEFLNINNKSIMKDIFKNVENKTNVEFKNANDYYDFAEVGKILGIDEFILPLKELIEKHEMEQPTFETVLEFIKEKDIINRIENENYTDDREITFISQNF